jgi:hypothetical protein
MTFLPISNNDYSGSILILLVIDNSSDFVYNRLRSTVVIEILI